LSTAASNGPQLITPIVAQKSGSTLKVMLGKVVGSVSGKKTRFNLALYFKELILFIIRLMDCTSQYINIFSV
jgi:hypothetical protein